MGGPNIHRGKIFMKGDELLLAFELKAQEKAAGYFLRKLGTTVRPDLPTAGSYPAKVDYAEFAVEYVVASDSTPRTVNTKFGLTFTWSNETGEDAYLGVFKGYAHPPYDNIAPADQVAAYYIMVATEGKPDPEDEHTDKRISKTSLKFTINRDEVKDGASPVGITTHYLRYAPFLATDALSAKDIAAVQNDSTWVVDGQNDDFLTGVYTIVRRSSTSTPVPLVNINTASRDALIDLPGIGPALADRIIAERLFNAIEDILRVGGIGPALFDELRYRITV